MYNSKKYGQTPLFFAAQEGDSKVIALLINKGANINEKDKRGYTPIMAAIFNGNLRGVRCLLENGADVTVKTNKKNTALKLANDMYFEYNTTVAKEIKNIIKKRLNEIKRQEKELKKKEKVLNRNKSETNKWWNLCDCRKNNAVEKGRQF